jgi:hypothetical protein
MAMPGMSGPAEAGNPALALVLALLMAASLDTRSWRRIKLISGLLIRGLGVRVPGGAPVLTWGFIAPGHFLCVRFVPMFAPYLLACRDPVVEGLSKTGRPALVPLDHWSRPPLRKPGAGLEHLFRCRLPESTSGADYVSRRAEQVPLVAGDVAEHSDAAVRFRQRGGKKGR